MDQRTAAKGGAERLFTYLSFDPGAVTGDLLKQMEEDSTIQLLSFPFANGELYNDEFAFDEEKAAQLEDGNLYAVLPKSNRLTET